jgi:DNA polymerase V
MFALVDCNNFFASCEMVFNPKLAQKPLVILSNNDGCIVARSAKAKALGIKMGDPAYLYKHRADVVMLSGNFPLYSDMSQRVMQTLDSFSPDMEIYSIDEAFFKLDESKNLYEQSVAMRNKVKQWTGIPISIGIAPTKTLAKLASKIAKKASGVYVLTTDKVDELLAQTELNDIWGIGSALTQRLKRKGIYTALQLTQTDDTWIRKILGTPGLQTVLELRGKLCFELNETPEKKKSIVCSRSFGQKVQELASLEEAVATFTASAAEKLREQESFAGFISVFISTNQDTNSCHIQLPNPSSYTPELISLAKRGLSQIYRPGLEYRKAGVLLGDFSEAGQNDFITPTHKNRPEAMKVLDQINAKYDKPALRFAAEGLERPWKSKKGNSSPKFTTNWNDLVIVN